MLTKQQVLVLKEVEQFLKQDQMAHAIALLNSTLKQSPTFYQAWLKLSECLFRAGYFKQAIEVHSHAENFDPLTQEFEQIKHLIQKNLFNEATQVAEEMLKQVPHHPRAIFTLAHVSLVQNDPQHSAKLIRHEVTSLPANISLRFMLIDSYVKSDDYEGALSSARALVELHESFDTLWVWIGLLLKFSQVELLVEKCERAQRYVKNDNAKYSQLALVKGQALRIKGERENSIQALKMSIQRDPNNADAWSALADMKNYEFSKPEIKHLESLVSNQSLPVKTRGIAMFALAKAIEVQGGIEASMPFYEKANSLIGSDSRYIELMTKEFEDRKKSYSKDALLTMAKTAKSEAFPIFIVGMPRSGSTLVEQILASHSQIEATIEQPTLAAIEKQANKYCQEKYGKPLHECLESLTAEELTTFGQSYIEKGSVFREKNLAYFIDKQPFNYRLIGFIHKILPNAFIIDVRRNAMDCGLSLYKQLFHSAVDFSYDLKNIAHAINAYHDLMEFWHKQLPNRVIHVQYETLVNSANEEIERLLSDLSLSFEPACLRFHENTRKVHTASSEQVRRPLNTDSINIWQKVETQLQLLRENLV